MWKTVKTYVISILIALTVGVLSALITRGNMMIYGEIIKPPLAPQGFIFPIVWTFLYILMGVSSARVFLKKSEMPDSVSKALKIYELQLIFNFFWSLIFFNLRAFLFSFVWLVALWVLILLMIIKFYKIERFAGLMNIPYLLWVTFAGYLNLAIYILN